MTRSARRTALTAAAAVASVLLIAAVPVLRRGPRYPFVTSSTVQGFDAHGALGDTQAYGVLFHTKHQADPWVEIDLGEERPVHAVEVTNRHDCCRERAVPMLLELAGEDRELREAGRVLEPFDEITIVPEGAPIARYVRLRVLGTTMFHLSGIRVR